MKTSVRFFLALALACSFAACAKRETPVQVGTRTQTLLVGNGDEPRVLDPHLGTGLQEGNILLALFEGLTAEGDFGEAVPAAAERWDVSAGGLVYTFHLRPNLRWSNGDRLTAEDFVFSFRRMLIPQLGAEYAYMLWPIKGAEPFNKELSKELSALGLSAPDAPTLRIELAYPTPYLPLLAAHFTWLPVPPRIVEKFSATLRRDTAWTRPGNLVSNGPFQLAQWTPNARIVVSKNPHYWDAASQRLNQIVYRAQFPASFGLCRTIYTNFLRFNVARPPLTDPRVRRALGLAIDREAMCRVVAPGTRSPA